MKKFPCKNCEDRVLGCHGTCPKYAEAFAENERLKEVRAKALLEDEYHAKTVIKNRNNQIKRKMGR